MRQNNQNKRVRGRTRKGPNPLTRSYESNGPDVKIRGSAMHVAEKYVQLARDAQSAGDRVMAENYLQHAEHYFRIIAAAQGANNPQRDNDQPYQGNQGNGADAEGGNNGSGPSGQSRQVMAADAPQPFVDAMPGVNTKGGNGSKPPKGSSGDDAGSEAPAKAEEAKGSDDKAGEDKASEAKAEEAMSADAGEDAPKPKRRVRGTRGRGSRKTKAEDGADGGDEAKGAEAKSDGGETKADSAEGAVSEA
ncbi:DUF4167 domain-containing protein [Rhodobium gokarnense]|uniref:DUF4167 domain-containing protein n=1 Tax=Rhodobium gokarnense TaxID=364296 RepID=A0ABT3H8S1_9HYPH|nr:DUF4167 domain-containing protein [Rhodobium gokarnense]MCW2306786.1 hypothetical protein [Rhodobium gokarnense]